MKEKDVHVKTEYFKSRLRKPFIYGLGGVAWVSAVFAAPVAIVVMDKNHHGDVVGQGKAVYSFMNKDYGSEVEAERAVDGVLSPSQVWTVPGSATEFDSKDDAAVAYLRANPVVAAVGDGSGRTYSQHDIDVFLDVADGTVIPAPDGAVVGTNSAELLNDYRDVPLAGPQVTTQAQLMILKRGDIVRVQTNSSDGSFVYLDQSNLISTGPVWFMFVESVNTTVANKVGARLFMSEGSVSVYWFQNFRIHTPAVGDGSNNTYTQDQIDARDKADQLPKDPKAIVGTNSPERPNNLSDADKVVVKQNSKTKVEYGGKVYDDKNAAYKELITKKN